MKRIAVYILALAAAAALPLRGTDVGKLRPVGLVQLYMEGGALVIATDTGDSGRGETAKAAFENLEETTSGTIFLDTADYLLVSRSASGVLAEMAQYLKPSVRVCLAEKVVDPVQAAEYLAAHRPDWEMKDVENVAQLQTLRQENGRLILK